MRIATWDARAKRPPAPTGLFIALGLAFLGALGSATYSEYLDHDYSLRRAAYDSSQVCADAIQITRFRYVGDAQVVSKTMPAQDPRTELKFIELSGLDVTAYLHRTHTAEWNNWEVGTILQAELWQGSVTKVAGVETLDNPHTLPEIGPGPAIIFGAMALVCGAGIAFYLLLNIRSARGTPSG